MSGLSIPMPKALVAAMIRSSPMRNRSWMSALFLGRQPGVEMFRRQTLLLEEIGDPLRLAAGRAIDDGTRSAILWQLRLDHVEDIGQLGAALRWPDLKAEIGAHGAAVQQQQFDARAATGNGRGCRALLRAWRWRSGRAPEQALHRPRLSLMKRLT